MRPSTTKAASPNRDGDLRATEVEVAGIEPASDDVEPGLLRVQSVMDFLGPHHSHGREGGRAQSARSPDPHTDDEDQQWLSR